VVQVLNLFLALLLSSFGTQSLQSSNNGENGGGSEEAPNKLMEAIDRIRRWSAYLRSRCRPLSTCHQTTTTHDDKQQSPLLHHSLNTLPDLGQSDREFFSKDSRLY